MRTPYSSGVRWRATDRLSVKLTSFMDTEEARSWRKLWVMALASFWPPTTMLASLTISNSMDERSPSFERTVGLCFFNTKNTLYMNYGTEIKWTVTVTRSACISHMAKINANNVRH